MKNIFPAGVTRLLVLLQKGLVRLRTTPLPTAIHGRHLPVAATAATGITSVRGEACRAKSGKNSTPCPCTTSCDKLPTPQKPHEILADALEREKRYTTEDNRSLERRQRVAHLPCQWFITWLSGISLTPNSRGFRRSPLFHVMDTVGIFFLLIGIAGLLAAIGGVAWIFVPPVVLIAAGRARKAAMTILHQAAHHRLLEMGETIDRLVANICTVAIWLPTLESYVSTHAVSHHSSHTVAAEEDEDAPDFYALGFTPGKTVRQYWALLIRTLCSPCYYVCGVIERVKRAFCAPRSFGLRFASGVVLAGVVAGFIAGGAWAWASAAYFVALFGLAPVAALLQQVSEHLWGCYPEMLIPQLAGKRLEMVCLGRFNLDRYPLPGEAGRRVALLKWFARLPIHVLVRLTITPGDLPAHAVHHLHASSRDWTAYADWTARAYQDEPQRYRHCWSLHEALQRVFCAMAISPKQQTTEQNENHEIH